MKQKTNVIKVVLFMAAIVVIAVGAMPLLSIGKPQCDKSQERYLAGEVLSHDGRLIDDEEFKSDLKRWSSCVDSIFGNHKFLSSLNAYDCIQTTIDVDIQHIVRRELQKAIEKNDADWATGVISKVKTGEVVAIVNQEGLKNDSSVTKASRYASSLYEPGSVFAAIPMTIALEDKLVSGIDEVIATGRSYVYGGERPIVDSHWSDSLSVRQIFEYPSYVGLAKIIDRKYYDSPQLFRVRLAETGFFTSKPLYWASKKPEIPEADDDLNGRLMLSRQVSGYGVEVSPLSLLGWYNALANGGKYVNLRIVKDIKNPHLELNVSPLMLDKLEHDFICSEQVASAMCEMLYEEAVQVHRIRQSDSLKITGKTGSSFCKDENGYLANEKHYTFAGFFPAESPEYSCIVVIKSKKKAFREVGNVAKTIASQMFALGDYIADENDY